VAEPYVGLRIIRPKSRRPSPRKPAAPHNKHDPAVHNFSLCHQSNLANAIIYWKRALKINPRYTDANFNIAAAYMESNQPDKAIPHLKAELALNPSNRRAIEALNAVIQTPRRPQK